MDTSTEPTPTPNKFAKHFRDMADRIERNPEKEFSGAFLYVTPSGKVIAFMIADPNPDAEAFLSAAMGKLMVEQQELQNSKGGFAPRR